MIIGESQDCWSWVVDCQHVVEPVASAHHAVKDAWIRSLAYDRATQCLEVRFTWKNVHQYRPVPLWLVRKIWKAPPMNMALQESVMKNRRIRFEEVRTEGKLLMSLLRGWQTIPKPDDACAGKPHGA